MTFIKLGIASLLILGITSGCSFIYPVYQRPKVAIPQHWSNESISLFKDNTLPYLAWWNKFHDPVLDQLIQCGLATNNTVGQARGNIERAQGELLSVQLSWLPSPSLMRGFSQNPGFGSPAMFYGTYPGYFAFNIFNTLSREKSARINLEAQHYMLDATNLILIGQIASSYYTYTAELEQQRLYARYIKDIKELLDIQLDNYKGGINSLIVVQETKELLGQITARQYTTENNVVKSQNALRYLINQNPGKIVEGTRFNIMKTSYPGFGSLPATVLADRPDVAYAESQYRIAVQNIGVANTQLLPMVELDYFYGHVQQSVIGTPVKGPAHFADAYVNWVVDPTVFGEIRAFTGAKKVAYYAYVDSIRNALREVANDLSTHQKANQRYGSIKEAYQAAKKKYVLDNDLYKQGVIAYNDLVIDKLAIDDMALQLNEVKLVQMLAVVSLYQDLGGGYKHC